MFLKRLLKPHGHHKGISKALNHIGHSAGKWTKHAAEDSFHFGTKAVKGAAKWTDKQFTKVTNVANNTMLYLAIGGAIVVLVLLMKK